MIERKFVLLFGVIVTFLGIISLFIYDSSRRRKLALLHNRIDNGFEADTNCLSDDWSNVYDDLKTAYEKMEK